jgi:hypothetical protein
VVDVTIEGDRIRFAVRGWDKLWSMRSELEIPLAHIRAVRQDPERARGWWHGLRMPGTNVPGVLTAGTFLQHGGAVFYDVHDPEQTVVLELDHEFYHQLVIEVEHPASVVRTISAALQHSGSD